MLIIRIALALGLALLLVIAAWSSSHRSADAHTALCLAPGVSAAPPAHGEDPAVVDAPPADVGAVAVAALCCVLLVLLIRRVPVPGLLRRTAPAWRRIVSSPAGARRAVPALTLIDLSLSRT